MKRILFIITALMVIHLTYGQNEYHFRYWFDHSKEPLEATSYSNLWQTQLDVSHLQDGLHTMYLYVQDSLGQPNAPLMHSFIKMAQIIGSDLQLHCFIDNELYLQQSLHMQSYVHSFELDMSALSSGLHQMRLQFYMPDGTLLGSYSSLFYRVAMTEEYNNAELHYSIDGQEYPTLHGVLSNGGFHYDLDVTNLTNGIHRITGFLTTDKGLFGSNFSSLFYKIPVGGTKITKYEYWLNGNDSNINTITLPEPTRTYELVTLLPMETLPVRSSCFQFAYTTDGKPIVYAKNDLQMRFWDNTNMFVPIYTQYIDENVVDTIMADTLQRNAYKTFPTPMENEIRWYQVAISKGDSIAFRSNRTCTLEIFSPSAANLHKVSGKESTELRGIRANEDGIYYLAVHDVTSKNGNNVQLFYEHVDKYAVMRYDVHSVGNGGYSTITFEGNGFDSLYSVYLVNAQNDTINNLYIGRKSKTVSPVMFDFTDATIGTYDIIFTFAENEIISIHNGIVVEEAGDIILSSKVSFLPYHFNSVVTYHLSITNHGNMTAYNVPMYVYIATPRIETITYLKFKGLELPSLMRYFDRDSLSEQEYLEIQQFVENLGDDIYFFKFKTKDEDTGDSIIVRSNYFYVDVAPHETKKITLELIPMGHEYVDVWFTIPDEYIPYISNMQSAHAKRIAREKASLVDDYCCIRERIECVTSFVADLSEYIPGLTGPVLGCISEALSALSSTAGHWRCMKDGYDDNNGALDNGNNTISIYNVVLDCAKKFIPDRIFKTLKSIWDARKGFAIAKDVTDCAVAFTQEKPNCPPGEPKGGKSVAIYSGDPNDIIGYTSEAGSKYMKSDVEEISYEIEFENDTAIATAPAHTIIVRDTLDANKFDLSSFAAIGVQIGEKSLSLNGEQQFVQTMDLRTKVNVIAQVQLDYNPQTGIAVWKITSLDPMTMEPTEDAEQGALPVNYDGSGVGSVSFSIRLREHFPEGTQISNQATIIFDYEAPIATPVWTNIIDAIAPHSDITHIETAQDSTITVSITGTDNSSGVWKYEVYAMCDTLPEWTKIGEVHTNTISPNTDFEYHAEVLPCEYLSLAIDSAGNREAKNKYAVVLLCDTTMGKTEGAGVYDFGATAVINAIPKDGYEFVNWSNGYTDATATILVESDIVLSAIFRATMTALIEQTELTQQVYKYMHNGHIYIIRGGKVYTMTGQETK